ncbi:hypothetical protein BSL82_03470 [Tardibacter chloracetimidivorans]|uniref:Phosphoribosyl-ATP pyrophosphohydrolase n=1 Tax=Tardibacter chloracetimidivorans TaxID=1921510 RepID=A0A1L3ZS71_9SPHN|nr:hypothetical protein BSL82_03470 [Tardibacter chloracetimidivorans]
MDTISDITALTREDLVSQFHIATNDAVDIPRNKWTTTLLNHRVRLIREEFHELMEELETAATLDTLPSRNAAERILKELADVQYVISGTAVSLGLDLELGFQRVHESNMSKIDPLSKRVARDGRGKVLKGPHYQPPNLKDLIYA